METRESMLLELSHCHTDRLWRQQVEDINEMSVGLQKAGDLLDKFLAHVQLRVRSGKRPVLQVAGVQVIEGGLADEAFVYLFTP